MKKVSLNSGDQVPALGVGTWRMGENPANRGEEIATLRMALDLGARLIDTAEMYGDGRSEELIGEALHGRRNQAFLVSKVYPHNATRQGTAAACERSLRRLKTDHLDLYLLHWRGNVPLSETLEAFLTLQASGKIRYFGVSNLDLNDMRELSSYSGGTDVSVNQLLYNLSRRGIEWDLLPWLRDRCIPVMAYSPIEQGRLLLDSKLISFSRRHGVTPAQAALGWLLAQDGVVVIPKTSRRERLQENFRALARPLAPEQVSELEDLFPAPTGPHALEML